MRSIQRIGYPAATPRPPFSGRVLSLVMWSEQLSGHGGWAGEIIAALLWTACLHRDGRILFLVSVATRKSPLMAI